MRTYVVPTHFKSMCGDNNLVHDDDDDYEDAKIL